jgi:hypothetical protein
MALRQRASKSLRRWTPLRAVDAAVTKMNDERSAAQIKRLADLAHANGLLVSVGPFDDRGAALVIDDPLDASGATVRMPASMALALLELIETEPERGFQGADEFLRFERECLLHLDRIIERAR